MSYSILLDHPVLNNSESTKMMASSLALDMALLARNGATANNGTKEAVEAATEAKVKAEADLLRSPVGGHNNPHHHHHHHGDRRLPFSITNILSQQQVSFSEMNKLNF